MYIRGAVRDWLRSKIQYKDKQPNLESHCLSASELNPSFFLVCFIWDVTHFTHWLDKHWHRLRLWLGRSQFCNVAPTDRLIKAMVGNNGNERTHSSSTMHLLFIYVVVRRRWPWIAVRLRDSKPFLRSEGLTSQKCVQNAHLFVAMRIQTAAWPGFSVIKMILRTKMSLLEELITTAGHLCLFLPKFHCDLNPIEMVRSSLHS